MYGELISSQTVGAGGVASITFSSIPQTYTDLIIVYSGVEVGLNITFNGNTSAQYTRFYLQGTGSSVNTYRVTGQNSFTAAFSYWGSAGELVVGQVYIPNYAGSTNKTISIDMASERNATNAVQQFFGSVLENTAAVTSIELTGLGTIPQYSTAYLYGLTKGSGGATVS